MQYGSCVMKSTGYVNLPFFPLTVVPLDRDLLWPHNELEIFQSDPLINSKVRLRHSTLSLVDSFHLVLCLRIARFLNLPGL